MPSAVVGVFSSYSFKNHAIGSLYSSKPINTNALLSKFALTSASVEPYLAVPSAFVFGRITNQPSDILKICLSLTSFPPIEGLI